LKHRLFPKISLVRYDVRVYRTDKYNIMRNSHTNERYPMPIYLGVLLSSLSLGIMSAALLDSPNGTNFATSAYTSTLSPSPELEDDTIPPIKAEISLAQEKNPTSVLSMSVVAVSAPVAYETQTVKDPSLYENEKVVSVKGEEGSNMMTYEVSYNAAGDVVSKDLMIKVNIKDPVDEVIKVGTKKRAPVVNSGPVNPGTNRAIGQEIAAQRGWTGNEWMCLDSLWSKESGWNHYAENRSSGAYGIPQSLPGNKMAVSGSDWATNPATQIKWGLSYIQGRYGTPCGAWEHSVNKNWY